MARAWRLRHRVFKENLGWEVSSVDLLEFDHFDQKAWHCAVLCGDQMLGYWRALCTVEPYLLELNFPALLEGKPAPKSPRIWEISRFALAPDDPDRRETGRLLVREMAAFGNDFQVNQILGVTEPAFERFLLRCHLPIRRISGPSVIGQGHGRDVQAMLVSFDVNSHTLASFGLIAEAA
ncbi:MAG TPA: acyl-homoserine-lactone synthase [Alphaproteobacteria bacterium]|nr:acyl-homoserine-lactone synthase [Alphaproteobacteria bacterium]